MSSRRLPWLLAVALAVLPGACSIHVDPLVLDSGDPGAGTDEATVDDGGAEDPGGPADLPQGDDAAGTDLAFPDEGADPGPDDATAPDTPDDGAAPDGTCVPDCTGRRCGDNGCGGPCGVCGTAQFCTPDGQCQDDPDNPGTCEGAHGAVGCCSPDGATAYRWDGSTVVAERCPGGLVCGWDAPNLVYRCVAISDGDPTGRFPLACGGGNPYCDGIACGNDDGCGQSCGCGAGYACRADAGACVYTDWTATYQGQFMAHVEVRDFLGNVTGVGCEGGLTLGVQVGASPAVEGEGRCVAQVSLVSVDVRLFFKGDIQDLDRAAGFVQYEVNGSGVGQGPFTGQFGGPNPRKLSGAMDSGPTYDNGQLQVRFLGANFDVVEGI